MREVADASPARMLPDGAGDCRALPRVAAEPAEGLGALGRRDAPGRERRPELIVGKLPAVRQGWREWLDDGVDKAAPGQTPVDGSACLGPLLRWVPSWWQAAAIARAVDATFPGDRGAALVISVLSRGSALPGAGPLRPANQEAIVEHPAPGIGADHRWHRPGDEEEGSEKAAGPKAMVEDKGGDDAEEKLADLGADGVDNCDTDAIPEAGAVGPQEEAFVIPQTDEAPLAPDVD